MPDIVTAGHRHTLDLELLRGSLITLRRRCGKPNCRCASGQPDTSAALSFSHNGRTKTVTLREDDLDQARVRELNCITPGQRWCGQTCCPYTHNM
jgi:hypothetical protein